MEYAAPKGKLAHNKEESRTKKKEAVTEGKTNMATTRMTPTDSRQATVAKASPSISPK